MRNLKVAMGRGTRSSKRSNSGQALLELTLVLLLLVVLLCAVAQWGIIYTTQITLRDATIAGARYAILPKSASSPSDQQIRDMTRNAAASIIKDLANINVSVNRNVTVGGVGGAVSVEASYPLTLILPYAVPGKASGETLTLSATTIMR